MTPQLVVDVTEQMYRASMLLTAQVFLRLVVRETKGPNRGEIVNKLLESQPGGTPGQAWCVAFIAWIYEFVCLVHGWRKAIDPNLSCSDLVSQAIGAGRMISATQIEVGDFVVVQGGTGRKAKDGKPYRHVAMAASKPDKRGNITTIEGNTNEAGGSEGIGVFKRKRNIFNEPLVGINTAPLRAA